MSQNKVSSVEVVSQLINEGEDLIESVTNDEDLQLRVVYNDTAGSRDEFETVIETCLESLGEDQDVDYITVDSEYVAIISL